MPKDFNNNFSLNDYNLEETNYKKSPNSYYNKSHNGSTYQVPLGRKTYFNSRNNPCPVCGDVNDRCRSLGNDGIVHCKTGDAINPADWKHLGDDGIGLKMMKPLHYQIPKLPPKEKYKKPQKYSPISDIDRATEFKKVFKQLGLSTPHRNSLRKRGLTPQQIDKYQIKSIDNATELVIPVKPGMPLKYGAKFNIKGSGQLIPVWQGNKIVGAQIRPDDTSKGKYFWLKAGDSTSHLQSSEMPLSFIIPDEIKRDGVGICESVGFKPILTAERLGQKIIGAAGGNFVSGRKQLLNFLKEHHTDKNIPVTLYPDAGGNDNELVFNQYNKLYHFLRQNGYTLQVAWWEQWNKETCDDIDDYLVKNGNNTSDIKLITWDDYTHQRKLARAHYNKNRKFKASIILDSRYLPGNTISKHVKSRTIVAVKSPMGTGKTEILKSVLKEHCEDKGALMLGTRNSLLMQSCERLGIYHLRNDDAAIHMKDEYSRIANCVDSLVRWDYSDLENRVIIIDEISSFIPHLLAGTTCKEHRKLILKKLAHALTHAYAIILLDANLKNWEVEYMKELSGFSYVTKIQNEYTGKGWNINFICGTKDENEIIESDSKLTANTNNYHSLISAIENNKNPVVITSDSQKFLESLHRILLAVVENPKDILRLDSHTVTDVIEKKFLENPDDYIGKNRPRVIMYSPTIDAGVSIDIKNYFTDMYAFRFHIGTDQFMQMLGRVRDIDCVRHIYSKEYSNTKTDNFSSPFENTIEKAEINRIQIDLQSSIGNSSNLNHYYSQLNGIIDNSKDRNLTAYTKVKAQENYESKNLRETLRTALIENGHTVKDIYLDNDIIIRKKYKAARDKVVFDNSTKMFNSPDILINKADEILSSWNASYEDRLMAEKSVFINRLLPGIQYTDLYSRELIEKFSFTDTKAFSRLNLRWNVLHIDEAEVIQQKKWLKQLGEDNIFIPDWRSPQLTASKYIDIGILAIIDNPDKEWTEDSPEIKHLCSKATHFSRRDYFPRVGKSSRILYINKILKSLGHKLIQSGRNGKRRYKLIDMYETLQIGNKQVPMSGVIMEIINKKQTARYEDAQTYIEQTSQSEPTTPNNIYRPGDMVKAQNPIDYESPPPIEPVRKQGDRVKISQPGKDTIYGYFYKFMLGMPAVYIDKPDKWCFYAEAKVEFI